MATKERGSRVAPSGWIAPQLATLAAAAPEGPNWIHEIKYDGYRLLAYVTSSGVRLMSRNQKDWTARFVSVAATPGRLRPVPLIVDGEAAVELESGVTSFQALQNAERDGTRGQVQYFAFDLLMVGGQAQDQVRARTGVRVGGFTSRAALGRVWVRCTWARTTPKVG